MQVLCTKYFMKILLVDSSSLVLQRLEELLSDTISADLMYKAISYKDAADNFFFHKPGVVVMDINLPQNASYRLINEIKQEAPVTLVIALSIHTDEYIRQQCILGGADFFFDKYDEFEKIPAVIGAIKKRFALLSA